jgi:hypothetical protein
MHFYYSCGILEQNTTQKKIKILKRVGEGEGGGGGEGYL